MRQNNMLNRYVALGALLVLAACARSAPEPTSNGARVPAEATPSVAFAPEHGMTNLSPDLVVELKVSGAAVSSFTLTDARGNALPYARAEQGERVTLSPKAPLAPGWYEVRADGARASGETGVELGGAAIARFRVGSEPRVRSIRSCRGVGLVEVRLSEPLALSRVSAPGCTVQGWPSDDGASAGKEPRRFEQLRLSCSSDTAIVLVDGIVVSDGLVRATADTEDGCNVSKAP